MPRRSRLGTAVRIVFGPGRNCLLAVETTFLRRRRRRRACAPIVTLARATIQRRPPWRTTPTRNPVTVWCTWGAGGGAVGGGGGEGGGGDGVGGDGVADALAVRPADGRARCDGDQGRREGVAVDRDSDVACLAARLRLGAGPEQDAQQHDGHGSGEDRGETPHHERVRIRSYGGFRRGGKSHPGPKIWAVRVSASTPAPRGL